MASATPALAKAMQQRLLLAPALSRQALLGYAADWPLRPVRVQVVRNTPFEPIASLTAPFLAHADMAVDWRYSDYDDSLSLARIEAGADLVLLWLDFDRYRLDAGEIAAFVASRIGAWREATRAPILVADAPANPKLDISLREVLTSLPGVEIYPRSAVSKGLGAAYHDARLARMTGSDLSAAAGLEHARDLGLDWLPALLDPAIKCVALDLDNTLYDGVLGEDGAENVQLTAGRRALQEQLVTLHGQGVLLAVVSKNEAADVEHLFEARRDFPLRPRHISARAVSWDSKAAGLAAVARTLNIGVEAILFVDDNFGEIAEAAAALPGLNALHAADAQEALTGLARGPGLRRLRSSREDGLRAADLAARAARLDLVEGGDYEIALKPVLTFRFADQSSIARLQELSIKTNQFNLALARLTASDAAGYLAKPEAGAVGVALSDALSDSGLVLSLFARRSGDALVVDDLCISCRALGRRLETAMALEAALGLAERQGTESVLFRHATGPRNGPARTWLGELSGQTLPEAGEVSLALAEIRRRLAQITIPRVWEES